MKTDIQINQDAAGKLADVRLHFRDKYHEDALVSYGKFKAKVNTEYITTNKSGQLILVTAISPTPAGEGKTTTTVGLADALRQIGKDSIVCLREPALGPVFGMKGGATGGGYSQVYPMEDINFHFTGDFAAISAAHNLLSAMIDNHINHGNQLNIDTNRITWKRVIDMNDRALRHMVVGLGAHNGKTREDGFDIVVASEVMAILCLADNLQDLRQRLGKITVAYNTNNQPVTAEDLKAAGAMAALLKDAIKPNLVQTLEGTPALIHGGPFANIAHGCNSVIATKLGLKIADYVVTEAGFGADLGAEKFIDIKCRKSGLKPNAVVLVATVRALKYHGAGDLTIGVANLERHVQNITNIYNLPCVVAVNKFSDDTEDELNYLINYCRNTLAVPAVLCSHWADGGSGAIELANKVVEMIDDNASTMTYVYESSDSIWNKIWKIAERVYRADEVTALPKVRAQIEELQRQYPNYPVCIAKTQSSFSTDPTERNAPDSHTVHVREVRLCTGAEFIVAICGDIMTMPGLPATPRAELIDIDECGNIVGLD